MRSKRRTAVAVQRALQTAAPAQSPAQAAVDERHAALAQALDLLEVSMLGIDAIENALSEARELAAEARRTASPAKRAMLAQRLVTLRDQIDRLAESATVGGRNLIGTGQDRLDVELDALGRERIAVAHFNLTTGPAGLKFPALRQAIDNPTDFDRARAELDAAAARLDMVTDAFRQSAGRIADALARVQENHGGAPRGVKRQGLKRRTIAR